jgi:hypothetical protein
MSNEEIPPSTNSVEDLLGDNGSHSSILSTPIVSSNSEPIQTIQTSLMGWESLPFASVGSYPNQILNHNKHLQENDLQLKNNNQSCNEKNHNETHLSWSLTTFETTHNKKEGEEQNNKDKFVSLPEAVVGAESYKRFPSTKTMEPLKKEQPELGENFKKVVSDYLFGRDVPPKDCYPLLVLYAECNKKRGNNGWRPEENKILGMISRIGQLLCLHDDHAAIRMACINAMEQLFTVVLSLLDESSSLKTAPIFNDEGAL